MKLTLFGATGGTGAQVLTQALAAGHHVTAIARHPESIGTRHPALEVIQGDVLSPGSLEDEIHGADAVLSALGAEAGRRPTTVYSQGTAAITAAMQAAGVTRFVGISASPVAPPSVKSPFERRIIHPMLYSFFGGAYDDMTRMEHLLAESTINWTIFRPPRLTNHPRTGRYRTAVDSKLARAVSISRADLADAMLAAIGNAQLYRHAVAIAK